MITKCKYYFLLVEYFRSHFVGTFDINTFVLLFSKKKCIVFSNIFLCRDTKTVCMYNYLLSLLACSVYSVYCKHNKIISSRR